MTNKKNTIITIFLFLIFVLVNLLVELNSKLPINYLLVVRSAIAIITLLLFKKLSINKHTINNLLLIVNFLFLVNLILNIINVYQLDRFDITNTVCIQKPVLCSFGISIFYKTKFFRFITLSSYFFFLPMIALFFSKPQFKFKFKNNLKLKTFYFIIFTILVSNLSTGVQKIYLSVIHSSQVLSENYYDRFTFKKGGAGYYGWIRVFSNFILIQTNKDSNFLIPPQSTTYKMEGNINYFRWFLYPRNLYHLEDLDEKIQIDYIVISAGECNNNDCVWPDYNIEKNKINSIITINRETQSIKETEGIDYVPANFKNTWGLIKLK